MFLWITQAFLPMKRLYRAKGIFEADKVIIVTQEYHLYRALYIAEQLGVDAYGVASDLNTYAGQSMRDFREVLARCKDWLCVSLSLNPHISAKLFLLVEMVI